MKCLWCKKNKIKIVKTTSTRVVYYCVNKDCKFSSPYWEQAKMIEDEEVI